MVTVKLAGHVLAIENQYDYLPGVCRDYLTEEAAEAVLSVTDEEIASENQNGGSWAPAYLESLAVYRKICERLLDDDILLFHCSALAVDGKAYLFTAPSGTGKSTHAQLWRERFKDRVVMINDDKPLLKIRQEEIRVYGTPYGGKGNLQTNTSAPVAGIVILHQAAENRICRISGKEAYPALLNQTYRRKDPAAMLRTLDLVKRLAGIPVWSLGCTISQAAVVLAARALGIPCA